jgi:hypothetical protein
MSRKYRQPGYMSEERERKPRAAPRERGAAARVETRFEATTRCNNCAAEIRVAGKIQFTDKCRNCGTDLHTCRNCLNFDPSARNECIKPVEVRVTNKSANNFCTFFEPKFLIEKKGSDVASKNDSHRQAFLDLFRK